MVVDDVWCCLVGCWVVVGRFKVSDVGWLMGVLDVLFGWRMCDCSCGWCCFVVVGVWGCRMVVGS